jgi:hypothetical protein
MKRENKKGRPQMRLAFLVNNLLANNQPLMPNMAL